MTLDLPAVTAALTTVPVLREGEWAALVRAVRDQADRQAIADLGVLYARAVDDHDIDTLVAMYTDDAVFERRGVAATGADEIRAAYVASFDTYRTMLHTPHPGVVLLHGDGTASGWSHGHAELATKSTLVMASYRYEDAYRCVDGRWLFAKRSITFMYAVPADEMAGSFGSAERMRWPRTTPEAGDYPESSPTWDTYRS
jgi:ketosteroid isomerase-like protein